MIFPIAYGLITMMDIDSAGWREPPVKEEGLVSTTPALSSGTTHHFLTKPSQPYQGAGKDLQSIIPPSAKTRVQKAAAEQLPTAESTKDVTPVAHRFPLRKFIKSGLRGMAIARIVIASWVPAVSITLSGPLIATDGLHTGCPALLDHVGHVQPCADMGVQCASFRGASR